MAPFRLVTKSSPSSGGAQKMNVSGRTDVSATVVAILLPSKEALTPNGDVKRSIGHKCHKERKKVRSLMAVSVREVVRGLDT